MSYLYESGAMRGHKNLNREGFAEDEARLIQAGYRVFNPAAVELKHVPVGHKPTFADYMERDLPEIADERCRGIALRADWKDSEGSRIEVCVGNLFGKPARPVEVWEGMDPEAAFSPLLEAQRLVFGPRQNSYGHPADDFARTAKIWSAILGHDITAEQVGLCMMGVKLSRQVNRPKFDNLTDLAGYSATVARIREREGR